MKSLAHTLAVVSACGLSSTAIAQEQTFLLPVVEDTSLITWSANNSGNAQTYGGRDRLHVGHNYAGTEAQPGGTHSALLRVDTSAISGLLADGWQVNGAELHLRFQFTPETSRTLSVHRFADANAQWVAGDGDGDQLVGYSSFSYMRNFDMDWASADDPNGPLAPGVDYFESPLGQLGIVAGSHVDDRWTSVVLSDTDETTLHDMLTTWDDGTNAGLQLLLNRVPAEAGMAYFSSASHSDEGRHPYLAVTLVPEPGSIALLGVGATLLMVRRRRMNSVLA